MYDGAGLTGSVYANWVAMSTTDFDKVDEACKCRSCMPNDHPWSVEKVYAMEAIVLPGPAFRMESAIGALEVCDFNDVSKYGDGNWIPVPPIFCFESGWLPTASCRGLGSEFDGLGPSVDGPSNVYNDIRTFFVAVSR